MTATALIRQQESETSPTERARIPISHDQFHFYSSPVEVIKRILLSDHYSVGSRYVYIISRIFRYLVQFVIDRKFMDILVVIFLFLVHAHV